MRVLPILLLLTSNFNHIRGKTNLLFANVTGTGENAKVQATCVSDDYNDAIAWITAPFTELIEPISANETLRYINFNWGKYGWNEEVAYNATFGPVMDYTWEMLPIIITRSAQLTQNYKFEKLEEIKIRNHFELNFSFLGKSSAQIYLCSHPMIKRGTCFIFIVGGWNGQGSVIRRCRKGASPTKSEDRLRGCENIVNKIEHKALFSIDEWNQISIRYINQQLEVITNDKNLLSYHAKYDGEFNNFTNLFIHSNTENALWKYHNYTYYETRKPYINFINSNWFYMASNYLCISFFANSAKGITLQLYDVSLELIKTKYYTSDQNTQWNYKTFYSDVYEDAEYYLRISFSPNDKIAIRNIVRHLDCKGSETNKFHFSSLEYYFDSANNIKCSSLRHKITPIKISLLNESTGVLSSDNQNHCNICTDFYNTTECPHRITCNEESCHCPVGYTGKYCNTICDRGKYGCNCASECANCNSNFCNNINGECFFGCNNLKYVAPFCKKRNLPMLAGIASTQTDCVTNCTITIYDKELKYDGVQEPKYYYTRIFEPNGTITEGKITSIKINLINFTNLIKECNYNYQIVLCVTDKKSECFIDDLTTFEFDTTCEELQANQIQIESVDRRTTINVTSYNPSQNCLLEEYYMLIRDEASNAIQYSKHLQLINTVLSLNIFTDYTVQLTKNNKIIHNIIFTTDESVPNKVRNITIISSSSSDLSVIWEAPTPVLGIITNYHVTWMFLAKRSCENENQNFIIQSRNVTTTAITLDNLKPYSIYSITVSAVTKKGEGDIYSVSGNTDATETNQLNTFNNKIITFETSIQIDLVVDCEHWSGPIYLNTYAICKSEWCEGEEMNRTKHLQYNDLITLDSLLPYTNYKLVLYQSHKNGDKFDNIYKLLSTNVMTRSTVPNQVPFAEVYSLSEASLSLRWSPPYPPTGILDSFIIKCHYISGGHSTQQTVNSFLNPCKIWPNMYCTTLTNLTTNQNYIISIAGRNQGNSNYGVETVLNETTWIRAPQPPLNLIAKWDEFRILHLQWQHPNKTNGPFFRFKIRVNNYQYSYQESESATYTFKTQFQCNPEIHRAIVSVETHNSKFCSAFLTHQFICPIFKPSLQFNPSAIHNSNNSITISIPAIEYDEAISNLYIVLLVNESDNTCTGDCREKIGNNHDSLVPIKENQTCWIVGHYDQRKYREIEKTHVNLNLSQIPNFNGTGELFEVGIVIINELGDQISSNWYLVDQCKWEKMEFSSILVSLLVLTILGIIITSSILGLLLWRKNRRKENANQFCKKRVNGISFPLLSMEEAKKRANYH